MDRLILIFISLLILSVGALLVSMPSHAETTKNIQLILK